MKSRKFFCKIQLQNIRKPLLFGGLIKFNLKCANVSLSLNIADRKREKH